MRSVVIKFTYFNFFSEIAKNTYNLIPKTQVFQILLAVSCKDQ